VAHLGPMTRSVADAALMMNVLSRPDARDWHSLPYDPRDYGIGLEDGVRGLRIAYSPALGYARVDKEIAALVRKAAAVFEELDARVDEVDPGFGDQQDCFTLHWFPGAAYVVGSIPKEKRKLMDPGLVEVARLGTQYSVREVQDAALARGALGVLMNKFHLKYDLLLTPSLPLPAFDAGREVNDVMKERRWTDWTPFSYPFNLTQQPAASVPCGLTRAGLPAGLQIVGAKHADALVLRAARAFESLQPIPMPDVAGLAPGS
jgi:aspartyl-tRNA(Asn)/glutamyl-tRNA(Gln) amidotransferase subunit A